MSCSWQEHGDGRYLRAELTGDVEHDHELNVRVSDLIHAEHAGSTVRVLYDVRHGITIGWGSGRLAELKQLARRNAEHCDLRVAVTGVRGPVAAAMLRGMSAVTGYAVMACRDEASALEYLFRR